MKYPLATLSIVHALAGCASSPELSASPTSENYAEQSKRCKTSSRITERIPIAGSGFGQSGQSSLEMELGVNPYIYARCMQAAGYSAPAASANQKSSGK